jgi:hypothetical protein
MRPILDIYTRVQNATLGLFRCRPGNVMLV